MPKKKIIKPISIDRKTVEALDSCQELIIHSEFTNTINIITDYGFVVVTTNKNIMPPLGMVILEDDFKASRNLDIEIDVSESFIYNSSVSKYELLPDARTLSIYFKRFKEFGLNNGLGISNYEIHSIFRRRFYPATLSQIGKIINEVITEPDSNKLKELLGRGIGLTPSGDDFIVGYLIVLMANEYNGSNLNKFLEFLELNSKEMTTDISTDYILKAIRGEFSQNILKLLNFMQLNIYDEKSLVNVLDFGTTSGVDTFLGMLSGYASLVHLVSTSKEESIV